MGNVLTLLLAIIVMGYGGYTLYKGIKRSAAGKGACACSSADCSNCPSRSHKN